jgi:hypothetical protein
MTATRSERLERRLTHFRHTDNTALTITEHIAERRSPGFMMNASITHY